VTNRSVVVVPVERATDVARIVRVATAVVGSPADVHLVEVTQPDGLRLIDSFKNTTPTYVFSVAFFASARSIEGRLRASLLSSSNAAKLDHCMTPQVTLVGAAGPDWRSAAPRCHANVRNGSSGEIQRSHWHRQIR